MNFENFRRTGELSDITVLVDDTEFKLHTFPLFTKSDFFKKTVESSSKQQRESDSNHYLTVRLDKFPGGKNVFSQMADFFYNIPIPIDHSNIIVLRSAACFVDCSTLATMLDNRIDDILLVARSKHDLSIPLVLLEQCIEYIPWAKQAHIVDKCLESIIDSLLRIAGTNGGAGGANKLGYHSLLKIDQLLTKSDREIIGRLPLAWLEEFIKLSSDSKLSIVGIVAIIKHYLTSTIIIEHDNDDQLNHSHTNSSPKSFRDNTSGAFTPVKKQDPTTANGVTATQHEKKISVVHSDDDKRKILDHVIKLLDQTAFYEYVPLSWLITCHQHAQEFNCECEQTLSKWIICALLCTADEDINNIR
ncbi:unnamed protein product [Didymodactylos carnosus]|uniref:BTB domain-containing protein n=1 Tax=Didymodactylos carnosus TaxID=1234261 RepID=A0A8S2E5P4_9BILA|nr:unnamed protein product [Didymodactylos carnosus]CAF3933705.1 unnamed protein product [Didymodactylos carnosus]